ncbi:phosphate ABC transporter ATP-binding protein [bacterium]|nr:MAG: phosphate ABC transporter ATP-binding protein [bacterium]
MAMVTAPAEVATETKIVADGVDFYYGGFQALHDISLAIPANRVTAFIGPSGCGKSTFLRCLNRMNDRIEGSRLEGRVTIDGLDVYDRSVSVEALRKEVGMVFQKPNPFPGSIRDNLLYGPRLHRIPKSEHEGIVERCLQQAALWDEVKDKLNSSGLSLSGGQQQRLCIARTLSVDPKIILMDEPCSALDPIATSRIEDLIFELKERYTIVMVTHNMQQAQRASDLTAFFMLGKLIEVDSTQNIFLAPKKRETEDYISGRFG